MYKRALLLTAASVALLSGQAFGDTTITKKTTDKLKTSTAGNIAISSGGSIVIPSNSTGDAVPAIEMDAASSTLNIASGGELDFLDTTDAIGIQADPGKAGEIINGGTINLTGTGTAKNGILFGDPGTTATGTFTGIADANNDNRLTAVILQEGSTLSVQGDGSIGIDLLTGNTVTGDILVGGSLRASATSLTTTTNSSVVAGVDLAGSLNGNFSVTTGGSIGAIGAGSDAVLITGALNGAILNEGVISAAGTNTTITTNTGNPQSGSAFVISNNVTGGFYNSGPAAGDTTTTRASIVSSGGSPTLYIVPGFTGTLAPVTIGGYADPVGSLGTASILNRGSITSAPVNVNTSASALAITGLSATNNVTLTNGIVNAGVIQVASSADPNEASAVVVAAVNISSGDQSLGAGSTVDIVGGVKNVAESSSGSGLISAALTGDGSGIAYGIIMTKNTTVTSIANSGTIQASAFTTDSTISNLAAFAILDQSGTLTSITNSGTISAASGVAGTGAALDNFTNIARAIDVEVANSAVTVTNTGNIVGEVMLSSFGDTFTVTGTPSTKSTVTGNINFGGGADTFTVGSNAVVQGDVLERLGGTINLSIAATGSLTVTNNGSTTDGRALPTGTLQNLQVSTLDVANGGTLGLTLAQPFNVSGSSTFVPIVHATNSVTLDSGALLKMAFGSFVSVTSAGGTTAQFVVFDAPTNQIHIAEPADIQKDLLNGIPFLFTGSVCAYDVTGFDACSGTNPQGTGRSDLLLNLTPKQIGTGANQLPLTGYAATMFAPANLALANDSTLGAEVIAAGLPVNGVALTTAQGNELYQKIYAGFAPDVSGSSRAIAISLTDQATGPVANRQRVLRMYANQDGDLTLWGQEFGQRLSISNKADAGGYSNTGFGFAMGIDGGGKSSGRYGGALTFYAGDTSEKVPRLDKSQSEWYMLTGYSDWRGRGVFLDTQLSAAYGHIDGKRTFPVPDSTGAMRVAEGKRAAGMLAGGVTTGFIWNAGGTVFVPQLSVDGLTMREEGYTESGGGPGMDLHVQPYYANSLRAFAGFDLREDLKFADFYFQPEIRGGYRYDFLDGRAKLKALFAGDPTAATPAAPGQYFEITGPDPAKGNLVAGGGFAVTTGAWSIGLSYDYQRGIGGTGGTNQTGLLTLLGRI